MIGSDDVVLFQGDSITDDGRAKQNPEPNSPGGLGNGYVRYAGAALLARHPGVTVHNRGISGHQVTNLADRWQHDCIDLKPTVLSVLIGVNDTWHGTAKGTPENGTSLEVYEQTYRRIVDQSLSALPGLKLVLCEPFITQAGAVLELAFEPEINERQAIVRRLADDYDAVFVPFQQAFDAAAERADPAYWAVDGVHPSVAGHMLMAQTWLTAVGAGAAVTA